MLSRGVLKHFVSASSAEGSTYQPGVPARRVLLVVVSGVESDPAGSILVH